MEESARQISDQVLALIASYGLNVLGSLAVLVAGLFAAGWAKRAVQRALRRTGCIDDTLTGFLGSLVKYAIVAITVIEVVQQVGVEATGIVAIFGAIGLALQGTLSNVAAGVMLLLFRPFKIGDYASVRYALTNKLKAQLEADGISIPFPQRLVHMTPIAQ